MAQKRYAYCFKCQEAREVKDSEITLLTNGKKKLSGKCVHCGSSAASMMKKHVKHDKVQTKKQAKESRKNRERKQTRRIADLRRNYNKRRSV